MSTHMRPRWVARLTGVDVKILSSIERHFESCRELACLKAFSNCMRDTADQHKPGKGCVPGAMARILLSELAWPAQALRRT